MFRGLASKACFETPVSRECPALHVFLARLGFEKPGLDRFHPREYFDGCIGLCGIGFDKSFAIAYEHTRIAVFFPL
jgi:hypothetical protein